MSEASPAAEPGVVTPAVLRGWPLPSPGGSKDEKGRLLIVGGGDATPGAVLLAAEAALRVGAGKVQVATTAATATLLAVALPECLVIGLDTHDGELAGGNTRIGWIGILAGALTVAGVLIAVLVRPKRPLGLSHI